jgi:hypothetical protein
VGKEGMGKEAGGFGRGYALIRKKALTAKTPRSPRIRSPRIWYFYLPT